MPCPPIAFPLKCRTLHASCNSADIFCLGLLSTPTKNMTSGDGKNYGLPRQETEESPDPAGRLVLKRRKLDPDQAASAAEREQQPCNVKGKYPAERQLGNANKQCNNVTVAHEAARVLREWRQQGAKGDPPLMLALDSSTTQTGFALLSADIPADCIQLVTNDEDVNALAKPKGQQGLSGGTACLARGSPRAM